MSALPVASPVSPPLSARRKVACFLLPAILTVVVLLPLPLLDRPPAAPRLTFIGLGDSLSILLEGAGGGRVLIGGGATQSELPAALGRQLRPWDNAVDLLLVMDRRDLPGATELARRGQVRAVATVGLADDRATAAALAALRETCAARGVAMRAIAADERIAIGRAGGAALDILVPASEGQGATVRLTAGPFAATLLTGEREVAGPILGAILPRASQELYRAAFAAGARLIVAPAPPDRPEEAGEAGGQLLLVGRGERATLGVEGAALRLRGVGLVPLDPATARR